MRLSRGPFPGVALPCPLAFVFALRLAGANGRDFAGFYQVSGVSQQGDSYQFTFKARVFNYSGSDVTGATIKLMDRIDPRRIYATFAGVSVASRESTVVSSSVAIPSRKFHAWQQGAPPRLVVQFVDGQGKTRLAPVELALRPVE